MLDETNFQTPAPGAQRTEEPTPSRTDFDEASGSMHDERAPGQGAPASSGGGEGSPAGHGEKGVLGIDEWLRRKDGSLGSSRFEFSAPVEAISISRQMVDRGDYKRDP
jgi:hypothetical protein